MPGASDRTRRVLTWALALAVALVVVTSRVRDVRSDPRATLVVAQVLLRHGTLRLDSLSPEAKEDAAHVLVEKGGHVYSRFPLGTSLLSLPAVAVATALGVELERYENERLLQVMLAAGVSVGIVLLLARIARRWVSPLRALALAAITWFGTSFASTQATALWSHDFATLLALLAVALALSGTSPAGLALGGCLFLAYLCRPTQSVLAPAVLAYVASKDRAAALRAAGTLGALLAVFIGVSLASFGQALPDYYLPQRLAGSDYGAALFANLVSPSRGLFVFSPFLLLPLLLFRDAKAGLARDRPLVAIALLWPLVHLLLISRLGHFWGGYSYGPRFMTDVLPGLFVLTTVTLASAWERGSRAVTHLLALLGAWSFLVHTVQGLYNPAVKRWNAEPSVDRHPELVFDWRYPQFLHTKARHAARLAEHPPPAVPAASVLTQ